MLRGDVLCLASARLPSRRAVILPFVALLDCHRAVLRVDVVGEGLTSIGGVEVRLVDRA